MQITCAGDMMSDLIGDFELEEAGDADIRGFGETRLLRVADKASGPIPTFASLGSTHPSKCRNQKDH